MHSHTRASGYEDPLLNLKPRRCSVAMRIAPAPNPLGLIFLPASARLGLAFDPLSNPQQAAMTPILPSRRSSTSGSSTKGYGHRCLPPCQPHPTTLCYDQCAAGSEALEDMSALSCGMAPTVVV
eukprot:51417-Prorocentrum_minimum.AAC.1